MTTTPENSGWRMQLAVHGALRRDVGRLAACLAEGQDASPATISAHWTEMAFQLRHHHQFEDAVQCR